MKKVVKSFKKQFKVAKEHPIISIGCTLFVLLVVGGLTTLVVIGADTGDSGGDTAIQTDFGNDGGGDDGEVPEPPKKLDEAPPAPIATGAGTLDVARRVGRFAIAQARGTIKTPNGMAVRVSAAPKQPVTVDYQLSCYKLVGKEGVTKIAQDRYTTTPPETRDISLPLTDADECLVTVSAQLTEGSGRIKVAVLSR